jgi:hypothetical protein
MPFEMCGRDKYLHTACHTNSYCSIQNRSSIILHRPVISSVLDRARIIHCFNVDIWPLPLLVNKISDPYCMPSFSSEDGNDMKYS